MRPGGVPNGASPALSVYPKPIQELITFFTRLPGLGPKTAERYVFALLKQSPEERNRFAAALRELNQGITSCSECLAYAGANPCGICGDLKRDHALLCIVEKNSDIAAIEKAGEFAGTYFVLGTALNPLKGIAPEQLPLTQLLERILLSNNGWRGDADPTRAQPEASTSGVRATTGPAPVSEIILGLNPTMEGETTALFLTKTLKDLAQKNNLAIKLTRLARGLPSGGEVEYADEITLKDALRGRREI